MTQERRGSSEAWDEIGFHRPLGGMFFNILPVFLASGFGLLFNVWLIPSVIFPFPEAMGYQTLNSQIFGVFFTLFDMGIGIALYRFIAEKNVSDPRKTIDYIRSPAGHPRKTIDYIRSRSPASRSTSSASCKAPAYHTRPGSS